MEYSERIVYFVRLVCLLDVDSVPCGTLKDHISNCLDLYTI